MALVPAFRRVAVVLGVLATLASTMSAPAVAATLAAPSGLGPDATAAASNPVLSWAAVPGAVSYDVQVATDPSFAAPIYSATTAQTAATPTTTMGGTTDGTVYWRVRAVDAAGVAGPYTTAQFWRTALPGPALLTPTDGAVLSFPSEPPLLSWTPLPGAAKYTVQIDDAQDFVGATSYTTTNPSLALTTPQPAGQPYFWRVQGVTNDGIVTSWSQTRQYSTGAIGAPVLSYPADGTDVAIDDVVLVWQPVAGAVTYHLQVSPNVDFSNNTYDVDGVKSTRWSPATTLPNGSYYWRVQARDVQGAYGAWSSVRSLRRAWPAKPNLLTPADGVTTTAQGPTFTWTPVSFADRYELDLGTDTNFSPGTYTTCFSNHTTFTTQYTVNQVTQAVTWRDPNCDGASEPVPGSLYWWRVRGLDDPSGVLGVYSDSRSFSYTPVVDSTGGLTVLGPADGATVTTPTLSWTAVPGTISYSVKLWDNGGTKLADISTDAVSWTSPNPLVATHGPFTWQVAADTGAVSYAAQQQTFSIGGSPTTTASPDPLQTSASTPRMPMMAWSAVTGATSYKVWVRPGAGCVDDQNHPWTQLVAPGTLGTYAYPSTTYPSDTAGGLSVLAPGDYDWFVQADLSGGGAVQSSCASYTIAALDAATGLSVDKPAACPDAAGAEAVCDTPTFSWHRVSDTGFYYVYISTDAAHTNLVHIYATNTTTLTPRESLKDSQAGQTYFWFVRPCVEPTACGALGDPQDNNDFTASFEKRSTAERAFASADGWPAPSTWPTGSCVPAAPAPAATPPTVADQPTFCWNDYLALNANEGVDAPQEAKLYRLQVAAVADFSSVLDTVDVDQTTYTPTAKSYPEGPLYWRVQAIDGSGNLLTPSPTYQLLKSSDAPVVVGPASGSRVDQAPVLQWTPEEFAASYEVEIYDHAGAASGDSVYSPVNRIVDATTKESAYTYLAALPTDSYAWRVRRLDADARPGPWQQQIGGQPLGFTVSPASPGLLAPASGATPSARSLLFTWTAAPAAAAYRFESSLSNTFASLRERVDTVSLAWAPTTIYATGTYHWRVSSIDGSGHVLSTSPAWTFTLDSTPPTVTAKSPALSAGLTDSFRVTFSEAVRGIDSTTAQLVAAGTTAATAATVTQPTATTLLLRPQSPLEPGRSYTVRLTSGITDLSGNPLSAYSWTVRASTTVDNASPAVRETWDRDTSWRAVGHRYSTTATAGARATLHFTGTSVQLLAHVAPDGGFASVRLDGRAPVKVSFYRSTRADRRAVWTATRLASTAHTLTVTALGTRPRRSRGAWVDVDAAKVGTRMIDDGNGAWTTRFHSVRSATAYDGSYDMERQVAALDTGPHAAYSVAFSGSGFTLYLARSRTAGRAQVVLDGRRIATLDLYAAFAMPRAPVLTRSIRAGHHTLTIVLAGTHDKTSRGTDVGLDEIAIR